MRRRALCWLAIGAALFLAPAAHPAVRKPVRIMSINECTDLLLLQFVTKDRIASVTYRAHGAAPAVRPGLDAGVAINHGTAEEILAQKPDLILAADFSSSTTRRIARLAGAPLVEVKSATSFDDIRQILTTVGEAVGEPERARALRAQLDQTLAGLAASRPPKPYLVAAWSGDSVPGKRTLANAIIEAAGAVNIASRLDNEHYNSFGLEELLAAGPDVLMYGAETSGSPSLTQQTAQNRVLRERYAGRRIVYPETLYNCGLPQSATAAADLRGALVRISGRGR